MQACQFQPFNTIYQLYSDLIRGSLDKATDFLMMPEYLMYRLTGVKSKDYTNAVTTGLVNAFSGEFDSDIINDLGLPKRLFPKLNRPGMILGTLLPEIAEEVGGGAKNDFLTRLTAESTGRQVIALPIEATSLGNLKIQMEATSR